MTGKWGLDGPPPEAYSRLTNIERFLPLHDLALAHAERLAQQFKVERAEGHGVDEMIDRVTLGRPSISLMPAGTNAAPLTFAFTALPGILVRGGHCVIRLFPVCGCDACDATAEHEASKLDEFIDCVVNGRFVESVSVPASGEPSASWRIRSAGGVSFGGGVVAASRAKRVVSSGEKAFEWGRWARR